MARFLWGLLTQNLTTKAMALLTAVALWTYAYYFSLRPLEVEVPVRVEGPEGWSVIDLQPTSLPSVALTYPTHAEDLVNDAVQRGAIRAVYRVGEPPSGSLVPFSNVRILAEHFQFPSATGLRVVKWEPQTISFTLAKEKTARLRVELNISPDIPPGYTASPSPWWSPRTVEVYGPSEALDRAGVIRTRPIVLSPPPAQGAPPRLQVGLQPFVEVEGRRYNVKCDERVDYIAYLVPEAKEKTFRVPVKTLHSLPEYRYRIRQVRPREMPVTVRATEERLERLRPEDIAVWVDVDGLGPQANPHLVRVHWRLDVPDPEHYEVSLGEPQAAVDIQPEEE